MLETSKKILTSFALIIGLNTANASLIFDFSFENSSNGGGIVTGVVKGLIDNQSSVATSVEVLTNPLGFGIGEYIGNAETNLFTVDNGVITTFDFVSRSNLFSPALQVTSLALQSFGSGPSFNSVAGLSIGDGIFGTFDSITFTQRSDAIPADAPASLLLILICLIGLSMVRYKAKIN